MDGTDFRSNPLLERFRGTSKDREAVYAEIYNGSHLGDEEIAKSPSKRRQRRIQLYKSIIGEGHEQILEVGCGLGDLTSGLAENARRVVGTDVSAKNIEVAKIRKEKFFRNTSGIGHVEFRRMGYKYQIRGWDIRLGYQYVSDRAPSS